MADEGEKEWWHGWGRQGREGRRQGSLHIWHCRWAARRKQARARSEVSSDQQVRDAVADEGLAPLRQEMDDSLSLIGRAELLGCPGRGGLMNL